MQTKLKLALAMAAQHMEQPDAIALVEACAGYDTVEDLPDNLRARVEAASNPQVTVKD